MVEAAFINLLNDPDTRLSALLDEVRRRVRMRGRFALAIGSTETSDITGISAAGADGEARRLTPAIDAESLVSGAPVSWHSVPVSPAGIVSPVVLSRAMINLLDCSIDVFDCGAFVPPKVQSFRVGDKPAKSLATGEALPLDLVERLFRAGQLAGMEEAEKGSYLVVGECVPAGTTTALGVLTALGYPARKLVSSSMPTNDHHDQRAELVESGVARSGITPEQIEHAPLKAVAALGDPMQPFVAGLALEASKNIPVVLGGGTQMLAVYALAKAIAGAEDMKSRTLAVVTTKWVAFDKFGGAAELARLVEAPFAAACPDFGCSRHVGLKAYEDGNVKEGVGAGALMTLAHLAGYSAERICETVDLQYDRMVVTKTR